jgi:glycosyltransferase involved in cell wall biosynthesis
MRIAIVAAARFPIREPFTGGLEAHAWSLARGLRAHGHRVSVFAGPGSDPAFDIQELTLRPWTVSATARADVSMTPDWWLEEHHAYLSLMLDLAGADYDVVHNNSLHYLPIAMAATLPMPVVTTLHTPPTPWLESAIRAPASCDVTFAAVSQFTAAAWADVVPDVDVRVVMNGVDLDHWRPGSGGHSAIWSGRIVPEKGPHLAVHAARRAGIPLRIAGPILDMAYFRQQIQPLLAGDDITYVGHLTSDELVGLVGASAVSIVTPDWDEPYGLVVAESFACGTPVAAIGRGAIPELIDHGSGRVAPPGNTEALAAAIRSASTLDRNTVRRRAVEHCSIDAMLTNYEGLYDQLTARPAA